MDNLLTKRENKDLKKAIKDGFIPDDTATCDPFFVLGTPFPGEIMAQWWSYNEQTGKHKLLGFRTYEVKK